MHSTGCTFQYTIKHEDEPFLLEVVFSHSELREAVLKLLLVAAHAWQSCHLNLTVMKEVLIIIRRFHFNYIRINLNPGDLAILILQSFCGRVIATS